MHHPHPLTAPHPHSRTRMPHLRSLALLLAFASACSQPLSSAPPAASTKTERAPTTRDDGNGTRAKGEESQPLAEAPEPSKEDLHREHETTPPAGAAPPAPTAPAEAKSLADQAQGYGMMGLGTAASQGASAGRLARSAPRMKSARAQPLQAAPPVASADPHFNTEGYESIQENRFVNVSQQALSTFSIDVDTASYSNARRFLTGGSLPPKDAIRIEEWINYFGYGYAPPRDDKPFAVHTEVASCPWNEQHRLVRIGIQGKAIAEENVPPRNLVFLIDVSGSMSDHNKLPLVKQGLSMLSERLRPEDSLAMVVYAGASGLVLPATSGRERGRILSALEQLEAGGSTNGGDGIRLAYKVAQQSFKKEGINRVILATDGDFNVGTTSEGELQRLIEDKRKSGVFLTVLGFGMGNIKDSNLELLADKGNGNYAYIDSPAEAHKVLVREAGSTLVTIAKDVKLQVEFNPARVASYKLIGYENRLLAKEDFNDDTKDAGEIGAGHSVTALYEVVPVGAPAVAVPAVDPLKYQAPGGLSQAATSSELLTVAVRYKLPSADTSSKFSVVVPDETRALAQTSEDFRFGVAVANVALLLRGSPDVQRTSLHSARTLASNAIGRDPHGDRAEFVKLVDRAIQLGKGGAVSIAR